MLSDYNKTRVKKEQNGNRFPVKGTITIGTLEEKQLAYVRHIGPYETLAKEYEDLIQSLFQEAYRQQLLEEDYWVLAIYHDNPEFGEETQFCTSLCLTVPKEPTIQEGGILGSMKLEGGLYAIGHFEIYRYQYSDSWNYMYEKWLTGSGYVPRNAYPFEVY